MSDPNSDSVFVLKEQYQVLPDMPDEQFEALKADIAERGVLVPIDVDEEGHILDGHHRYRACTELGITDFPTMVRPGLSEEDRRVFARKSNMLRRHLTRAQVRELIAEQLKDTPNWANNRIGQVLGVDSKTVKSIRSKLERTSEIPKLDKLTGADGKERPVKQKRPPAVMAGNTEELQQILLRVEDGVDTEDLEGLEGFMSKSAFMQIIDDLYDPFFHCTEDEKRQWHVFMLFGIATGHVEWILQRQFKSPSEWLGNEGQKFRRACRMSSPTNKFIKNWESFLAEHNESVEEIEKQLFSKGVA